MKRISDEQLSQIVQYWTSECDQCRDVQPKPYEHGWMALDLKDARAALRKAKEALGRPYSCKTRNSCGSTEVIMAALKDLTDDE